MSESILKDKTKAFAKSIVILCRALKERRIEHDLVNQLLRSGTSVGANVHEAQYAQGAKDFISKLEIALKEISESEYWLELLKDVNSITEEEFLGLNAEVVSIRRLLISSVTTLKSKL
ncbi:MAG: four helix bundle protein [Clostridia bacterium]|nr:four helix bundle protein [Clostridia bacterium]